MVSHMIFAIALINSKSCASLTGLMNESGTSSSSTTPNDIVMDLALSTSADKAVKAILPFLKELSEVEWWTGLLAAWIDFEVEGPPKSVSSFYVLILYVLNLYTIIATAN
jgi:hypothetical protein